MEPSELTVREEVINDLGNIRDTFDAMSDSIQRAKHSTDICVWKNSLEMVGSQMIICSTEFQNLSHHLNLLMLQIEDMQEILDSPINTARHYLKKREDEQTLDSR